MIRKTIPIILMCVFLVGYSTSVDVANILLSNYENKMISSGENRPKVNLQKDHLSDVLVLLHHRKAPSDIQSFFGWDDDEFERRIDILLENDFCKPHTSGQYFPTTMVITLEDASVLRRTARIVAQPASEVLATRVPDIMAYYKELASFEGISFEDASLLILSDVVLDNWQINNVEQSFLKKERTPRHGVNYYHSLQEKRAGEDTESLGIYGNQMWGHGTLMIGVYGNKRLTSKNLLTLGEKDFADLFGVPNGEPVTETRARILDALVRHAKESDYQLDPNFKRGFSSLGIMEGDDIRIPILNRSDYEELESLAGLVTNDLVGVLENHRKLLEDAYTESAYADEITLEEYLIWWYHFFYTEVTEILAEKGYINIPASGITTYVVDWS